MHVDVNASHKMRGSKVFQCFNIATSEAVCSMILLLLGIGCLNHVCQVEASFALEPSSGCAAIDESIDFECITATSGSVLWKRERTGESDTVITRNERNYYPNNYTVDYDNNDPDRISSTLTIDSMAPVMVGDVYFCEVSGFPPSAKAKLTEKDLSCSWCDSFDIYKNVTVNGKTSLDKSLECSGVDVSDRKLDFELDLELNSQQIGASVAVDFGGKRIPYEIPWDCNATDSSLNITGLDLSAGGSLTIEVTIDHPSLGGPHVLIENCLIPESKKPKCDNTCVIIICVCVVGTGCIVLIICICKRKKVKRWFCKKDDPTTCQTDHGSNRTPRTLPPLQASGKPGEPVDPEDPEQPEKKRKKKKRKKRNKEDGEQPEGQEQVHHM